MTKNVDFIDVGLITLAVIIIVVVVVLIVGFIRDYGSSNDYNYVDLDGNAGSADMCSIDRGGMWCKEGDKRILVKEYSAKKEKE